LRKDTRHSQSKNTHRLRAGSESEISVNLD
jgi:hypothetical protein